MNRRIGGLALAGALALGGVGTAVVAPALAATEAPGDGSTAEPDSPSTAEGTAERLQERVTAIREALDALVSAGTIDETQADAVAEELASSDALGRGGRGGPGGHGPGGGRGMVDLSVAATALGVTEDDLRASVQEGTSLAEVAEQQGTSPDELVTALVEAAEERLAERVDAGDITQEEADAKAAELAERFAAAVQREGLGPRSHGDGDRPYRGGATDTSSAEPSDDSTVEPSSA